MSARNPDSLLARIQGSVLTFFSTKLHSSIPLQTPQMVFIDSTNLCNFSCRFCPTGDSDLLKSMNIPRGSMDSAMFSTVIDQLQAFPEKIPVLYLQAYGEPLLNEDIAEMISLAKQANIAHSVQLITNGSLLSKEKSITLLEAGLDLIIISVEHVTPEGYKELTGGFDDYELIRDNTATLYREKVERNNPLLVYAKILNVQLTGKQIGKFLNDFEPISDITNIEYPVGWSNSKVKDFTMGANTVFTIHGTAKLRKTRTICPSPFSTMLITFDGFVSPCCVDWSRKAVVGTINEDNLTKIWNGPALNKLRNTFIAGEKSKLPACAVCHYMQSFTADNDLDDCREQLARIYEKTS